MKQEINIINLESLLSLNTQLNKSDDINFILNSSTLSLMGKLKYLRSIVIIFDGDKQKILHKKGRISDIHLDKMDFDELTILNNEKHKILKDSGLDVCLPIKYNNITFAVIGFGGKFSGNNLSQEELKYSSLVAQITANALQNAQQYITLKKVLNKAEMRNQLLTTLFEMTFDFSSFQSRDQIIKMLSFHLMGQLMVGRFTVILSNGSFEYIINRLIVNVGQENTEKLFELTKTTFVKNHPLPGDLKVMLYNQGVSVISPMLVQGKARGIMIIGKKMNNADFTENDIRFIEALGNTSIAALENHRLFKEEIEKKRLESELSLAHDIQKNLLPGSIPDIAGLDIAGLSIPSRHVGGDYYDFFKLSETRTLIAIADVSGKGMPASLIMANLQAALHAMAPLGLNLDELTTRLNSIIHRNTSADKFITFFIGILDETDYSLTYVNAGHNPPIYITSTGEKLELTEGGLILGVLNDPGEYETGSIFLKENELILLYTDGVNEALNQKEEEYGVERIYSIIEKEKQKPSDSIIKNIVEDIRNFTVDAPQFDDITLICLKK